MKNKRLILILGTILAAVSGLMSWVFLKTQANRLSRGYDVAEVMVAVKYISAGTRLARDMITMNKIPMQYIQPGAFASAKEILGQISLAPVAPGEQILANKFSKGGKSLSSVLSPGFRAIMISAESPGANLIQPGDYVDVLAAFDQEDRSKYGTFCTTIVQNVRVLANGNDLAGESRSQLEKEISGACPVISLAVTPSQAEILSLAERRSKLKLVLRPMGDDGMTSPGQTDMRRIFQRQEPKKKYEPEIIK